MKMSEKTKRITVIVLINVIVIISLFVAYKVLSSINFECVWHKKYGIYCATCGMTRAFTELIQLRIYQAFRYNELLFVFIGYGLYLDIATSVYYFKHGKIKDNLKHIVAIAIICSSFMLLRNIPVFNFLAPTII